jgi:hypothetical protein
LFNFVSLERCASVMATNHLKKGLEQIPEQSFISSIHQTMHDVQHGIGKNLVVPRRKFVTSNYLSLPLWLQEFS